MTVDHPAVGASATALLDVLAGRAAFKSGELLQSIEHRLITLEATGILEVNELARREGFLDLLLTACAVGQRTSRKEKLLRVRNAVVNCLRHRYEAPQIDSAMHLIEHLTEEHFVVLAILAEHKSEFSSVTKLSELYGIFQQYCSAISFDAFGYYLYELKYRRLIRLSEQVEDEEGLNVTTLFALQKDKGGETIIITEIARDVLSLTTE